VKPAKRPDIILPFSGELGDLDYRPARVVPLDTTIGDASLRLAAADFEYLVVADKRIPIGVVHRLDLIRQNMTQELAPDTPLVDVMARQVVTVQRDESVIESLMFMIKHNLQFLLVMDDWKVMGVVGQQDWLALQSRYPTDLLHRIGRAESVDTLARLRREGRDVVRENFATERDVLTLTSVVTAINDAVTRRVVQMAVIDLHREGFDVPPVPFAWIGMGSEGREAQTPDTDQDNGLIYEDVPEDRVEEVDAWFARLAARVVDALEECGFTRCAGDTMATNPQLRGSVRHWRDLFRGIVKRRGDEELFEASIYFDFRCLYGKAALVESLRKHLNTIIAEHRYFLRQLVEVAVQGTSPPINSLRWKLYRLTGWGPPPVDIKKNALIPLDAAIRVLALMDGVSSTRTLERLQQCLENGRLSKRLANDVEKAFDFLLRLRFKLEFDAGDAGAESDHLVSIGNLLPAQARYLADSLRTVHNLQGSVYEQVTGSKIHWSVR